jgi:predicted aldo/keto reductase-like oxidoreductase
MDKTFPEIKKNFGFGCMRLPMCDGEVDSVEFSRMIDAFLDAGFNYFDTAHGYLNGKSELALKECLAKRYPRERYLLANKLSGHHFQKNEDILPLFQSQLDACGVTYFDFYLMHAQDRVLFEKYKKCRAYEKAFELRDMGLVRHVGLSFHDKAEVLDQILSEYPDLEFVQIQFNYMDYEDVSVEGHKCYEVCRKHGKPVFVMEPVKGGCLVALPEEAEAVLREAGEGSTASFAIRFAAGFEGVEMVLSGMGNMDMIRDNLGFMSDFKPLSEREREAIWRVVEIMQSKKLIPCTSCKYCMERCPTGIKIPKLFACLNGRELYRAWNAAYYYSVHTKQGGLASACIGCGLCEEVCPQHLPIRELLRDVAASFEKK